MVVEGKTMGTLTILVTTLLLVGLALTIGTHVVQQVEEKTATETTASHENHTLLNGTETSLTYDKLVGISSVVNQSGTSLTENTDYTAVLYTGKVTLINNAFNNTQINFTYTYLAATSASTAADETTDALLDIGGWFAIIVIVVVAVIIIGLIMGAFQRRR
jgi:hypothetical protein